MARKVFFSFHYVPDNWRASQVRSMGMVEGNPVASDNDWEAVKRGGDQAIKRWINSQLDGRTCTVVLIGTSTANRPWINYEIGESWNRGMGVVGVYIHGLKNREQQQAVKGANPFDFVKFDSGVPLSSVVQAHDSPFWDSQAVYAHIRANLETWIETAILMRK